MVISLLSPFLPFLKAALAPSSGSFRNCHRPRSFCLILNSPAVFECHIFTSARKNQLEKTMARWPALCFTQHALRSPNRRPKFANKSIIAHLVPTSKHNITVLVKRLI